MAQIMRCCGCGIGWRPQIPLDPTLGASICLGFSPKKDKKTKKKKCNADEEVVNCQKQSRKSSETDKECFEGKVVLQIKKREEHSFKHHAKAVIGGGSPSI